MLPGLHKGGGVHKVRAPKTKRMADYAGVTIHGKTSDAEARKLIKASKKGMPKNVKSHGGLMRYAAGGVVKKAGAAL